MKVSVVIPAFNEELHIARTIDSLLSKPFPGYEIEVLVIDNNSTDKTAEIARKCSARVIGFDGSPVSAVRNFGVANSTGDIVVFIDADVSVSESWHRHIGAHLQRMANQNNLIIGSHCTSPEEQKSIIEKYWFDSYESSRSSHLGTGHMIVTRAFFDLIGGFDEKLVTGEDYDFCMRALKHGAEIEEVVDLKVVHYDYPKTILAFIKREAWHGVGDTNSLVAVFASKVMLVTMLFGLAHVGLFLSVILDREYTGAFCIAGIILICFACSVAKFRNRELEVIIVNTIIYYFYFFGRLLSFFKAN